MRRKFVTEAETPKATPECPSRWLIDRKVGTSALPHHRRPLECPTEGGVCKKGDEKGMKKCQKGVTEAETASPPPRKTPHPGGLVEKWGVYSG